jgi:hypothetical protein
MFLASFESLLGSIWFALAGVFAGYIAGNLLPLSKVAGWIKK